MMNDEFENRIRHGPCFDNRRRDRVEGGSAIPGGPDMAAPKFDIRKLPTAYKGSVKNLRVVKPPTAKSPGRYIFEFTDDYSVFDYGKMPDTIPGKGAAMAVGSAFLFERIEDARTWKDLARSSVWDHVRDGAWRDRLLSSATLRGAQKAGIRTHYRGLVNRDGKLVRTGQLTEPTHLLAVDSVAIVPPEPVAFGGGRIWNYNAIHAGLNCYLVPLECVFRFGVPRGSSLLERLSSSPGYHVELGLPRRPRSGTWLPFPIVEFFSKLEPGDRFLRPESALNFSGLSGAEFQQTFDLTCLIALFLLDFYGRHGVRVWDGKFEFLKAGGLMVGDAITPDELRLTYSSVQISKEPLRQYYKKYDPVFVEGMREAKRIAATAGGALRPILHETLGIRPKRLDPAFLAAAARMYVGLTAQATGLTVFGPGAGLGGVLETFRTFGVA
jgi:phosphoribosylaminoimidazole-succinocarboxamide synthase